MLTIEEIKAKKQELSKSLHSKGDEIGTLWADLFVPRKANSKGELVATIISNGITAFDTFMLVRKLFDRYGHLFGRDKKKRRR